MFPERTEKEKKKRKKNVFFSFLFFQGQQVPKNHQGPGRDGPLSRLLVLTCYLDTSRTDASVGGYRKKICAANGISKRKHVETVLRHSHNSFTRKGDRLKDGVCFVTSFPPAPTMLNGFSLFFGG